MSELYSHDLSKPAPHPDTRTVVQQMVYALENHSGNYKLTNAECIVHDAAIAAGQQWLEENK